MALLRPLRHKHRSALRTAFAVSAMFFSIEISSASAAVADPPYQDCNQARADGRSSIPFTDPAYRPELDFDGDGLACEPGKSRRSTR
ncbi:MAG TPA: excalibur calcium-binding domain-containing protein [Bryobacteraceae bacterium]